MNTTVKHLIVSFVMLTSIPATAQPGNAEKILGKWRVEKMCFLKEVKDSAKAQNELKLVTLEFEKNNMVINRIINGAEQFYKSGNYHVSDDGLGLFIGEDGGDIVLLNDQRLVVKVKDHYIMYFVKSTTVL